MDTLIRDARILKEPLLLSSRPRKSEGIPAPEAPEPETVESASTDPAAPGYAPHFAGEGADTAPETAAASAVPQPGYTAAHYVAAAAESVRDEERELLWRQELEAAKQEAKEEAQRQGYAEGYSAGLAAGEGEYKEQLAAVQPLLQSMREALEQEIAGAEDLLVEIVFAAVTKIVGDTLTTPEGVTAAVRQIVQHIKAREYLVIRVSPRDLVLLNDSQIQSGSGLEPDRVQILADDRVQWGGCLLETMGGNLDGRLEIQLNQLREILLKAKAQKAPSGSLGG